MAIAERENEALTKKALGDWYLAEKKDYPSFAARYPIDKELLARQDSKLEAMSAWCREMKISVTPTFFWNGYQLPDVYDIEDYSIFFWNSLDGCIRSHK